MKYPKAAKTGKRRSTVMPQIKVMRRNLRVSTSLKSGVAVAGTGMRDLFSGSFDIKHPTHAVMPHTAQLQAENGVSPGLGKANPQTVHVSRHGLCLRNQMIVGRIHAEAVIDIETCDAEFHQRVQRLSLIHISEPT